MTTARLLWKIAQQIVVLTLLVQWAVEWVWLRDPIQAVNYGIGAILLMMMLQEKERAP